MADHTGQPSKRPPADRAALAYEQLCASEPGAGLVRRLIELARDEDLGTRGDATSCATIDPDDRCSAALVAREGGTAAGLAAVPTLIDVFSTGPMGPWCSRVAFEPMLADGTAFEARATLARLTGPARGVLTLERTVLNLVSRLSGIATRTSRFVRAVQDTHATVCDTRKTTPGLRVLEKYAVRCGGGTSHRAGLFDAILIKDNHLASGHGPIEDRIASAARIASADPAIAFVMVEVDTLDQLDRVLGASAGVDLVLLDNMTPDQLAQAVRRRDLTNPSVQLEASGGITLETIPAVARSGVDRISTGSITHSAAWLDLGLDIQGLDIEPTPRGQL